MWRSSKNVVLNCKRLQMEILCTTLQGTLFSVLFLQAWVSLLGVYFQLFKYLYGGGPEERILQLHFPVKTYWLRQIPLALNWSVYLLRWWSLVCSIYFNTSLSVVRHFLAGPCFDLVLLSGYSLLIMHAFFRVCRTNCLNLSLIRLIRWKKFANN
jgi:hypothetical protein